MKDDILDQLKKLTQPELLELISWLIKNKYIHINYIINL